MKKLIFFFACIASAQQMDLFHNVKHPSNFNTYRGSGYAGFGIDSAADVFHAFYTVNQQPGCPPTCNPFWGPFANTFETTLNSTSGIAYSVEANLFLNGNTSGVGSVGIASYVFENTGTTSENFGIYTNCAHKWVGGGICIDYGAESDTVAGSTSLIIGFSSNLNANLLNNTATFHGLDVSMNYAAGGGSNPGYGAWIQASHGTHAAGLKVEEVDSGGTFTQMAIIQSRQSTNNILAMNNGHSGTNTGFPNQIIFSRGSPTFAVNPIGQIASDSITNGNFAEGYLDFWTAHSSVLRDLMRITPATVLIGNGSGVPTDNGSVTDLFQVNGNIDATGNITAGYNGSIFIVYRCSVAGSTLPIGSLTINASACGTAIDSGFRTK